MDEANQSPSEVPAAGDLGEAHKVGESNPPSVTMSAAELQSIRETFVGQDPELRRFSMWELLCVVTAASLVLAVGTYLTKPIFAGALGMTTLISMVALSAMKHPPAVLWLGWWILLLIYLMAIGSAVGN